MTLYYLFLAGLLVFGIAMQVIYGNIKASAERSEHFMGVNHSHVNDTHCSVTWLGGWDYESFIGDVRVNNVSKGHVPAYTEIWRGNCSEPVRVEMYERSARSYLTIYNHSGGV